MPDRLYLQLIDIINSLPCYDLVIPSIVVIETVFCLYFNIYLDN